MKINGVQIQSKIGPHIRQKRHKYFETQEGEKKIQCTQNTQGLLSTVHTITHTH